MRGMLPAMSRAIGTVTLVALVAVLAGGAPAASAAGGIEAVSPHNAWTTGDGLARSSTHLQTAWTSDCPPPKGRCATNNGPYMGVFWQRSRSTGWSSPERVSPKHVQAGRTGIAAAGSDVYVAWVSQTRYIDYKPSAARALSIRVSTDEGHSWGQSVQLSPGGGRVDYPVVAASGSDAWVVWTNADSGDIRMASSANHGGTWATKTIGSTTSGQGDAEGFHGYPAIGASGSNVAVAWIADGGGRQVALTSSTGGGEWSGSSVPTVLTANSPADLTHYPGAHGADDSQSSRVALAYTTDQGVVTRVFDGSSLGPERTVAGPWPDSTAGHRYAGAFGPAVIPSGTSTLAVAWAACQDRSSLNDACNTSNSQARVDILERESADNGATWSSTVNVGPSTKTARINEAPSLEFDGQTRILWLRRMSNYSSYRVVITAN
jgi:hypothetical protein